MTTISRVVLVGNPNSGKTSLFNALTGLYQKTGNFPGVTVDAKEARLSTKTNQNIRITDLPGIYSLYPKSDDEKVACEYLLNLKLEKGLLVVLVIDASNLKRSLLLAGQVIDLGYQCILAMNMEENALKKGISIDLKSLEEEIGLKVYSVNPKKGYGMDNLKESILNYKFTNDKNEFSNTSFIGGQLINEISQKFQINNSYLALLYAAHPSYSFISNEEQGFINEKLKEEKLVSKRLQATDITKRYKHIAKIIQHCSPEADQNTLHPSHGLDRFLTHKFWGFVIFFALLAFMFQAVYSWSEYPMTWIENLFENITSFFSEKIPDGTLKDLLIEGVVAGIGGIAVFIPQISILFAFIAILEDTGYMARVSFIMDKLLRKTGLNGRSVIPLVSSIACAVPAIMTSRTIPNRKERLITILVSPLMSCSARIPVYTILIAVCVPEDVYFWGMSVQGLSLMGTYLLGLFASIGAAWVFKKILKSDASSSFIMELPDYKGPNWKTIFHEIRHKTSRFLFDAGKIIIAISIILWAMASYAPGNAFEEIENRYSNSELKMEDKEAAIASEKLEVSYAGILGKTIEPVIKPLGFDWKIGIALISSFAAREVFVSTMATIYSVGEANDNSSIREKLQNEKDPETGKRKYSLALGLSLIVFYAFAMQCMSTLAVVYRETNTLKWPLVQLFYMTGMAWVGSFIVYQLMS